MKFIKIFISFLAILTLVACASEQGQDSSVAIKEEISALTNKKSNVYDFQVPAIFHNYEASENYRITYVPDIGNHIYQFGNIKSNETKIEYRDLQVQEIEWAKKENLAQLVENHDFSEVKKYTVNGNDFYVSNIYQDNVSSVNVYYNVGDNIFYASSYLVNEEEISDKTAKKICKDLSPR